MTISELREKLKAFPADMEVVGWDCAADEEAPLAFIYVSDEKMRIEGYLEGGEDK